MRKYFSPEFVLGILLHKTNTIPIFSAKSIKDWFIYQWVDKINKFDLILFSSGQPNHSAKLNGFSSRHSIHLFIHLMLKVWMFEDELTNEMINATNKYIMHHIYLKWPLATSHNTLGKAQYVPSSCLDQRHLSLSTKPEHYGCKGNTWISGVWF